MLQSNMVIPDLYFAAFRSTVDILNTVLGGLGRLQAYQIDAMQKLRSDQAEISRQIESGASAEDVRAAQAEFAREQMQRLASYWGGLYSTAYQSQIEVVKEAQNRTLALAAEMRQRLDAAPQGAEPMMSALRLVVDAAQTTCAAGVRATEQVERMAAAQIETTGQAVKSGGRAKRAA